jgi:exonuclease 3'-5' domain-containing protein 1
MWDGRQDFLEISDNYGVDLDGVMDLQIAEVVSRSAYRGEKERQRKRRLADSQFGRKDVRPFVYKYSDIQLMLGMQACLDHNKLGTSVKKDRERIFTQSTCPYCAH